MLPLIALSADESAACGLPIPSQRRLLPCASPTQARYKAMISIPGMRLCLATAGLLLFLLSETARMIRWEISSCVTRPGRQCQAANLPDNQCRPHRRKTNPSAIAISEQMCYNKSRKWTRKRVQRAITEPILCYIFRLAPLCKSLATPSLSPAIRQLILPLPGREGGCEAAGVGLQHFSTCRALPPSFLGRGREPRETRLSREMHGQVDHSRAEHRQYARNQLRMAVMALGQKIARAYIEEEPAEDREHRAENRRSEER